MPEDFTIPVKVKVTTKYPGGICSENVRVNIDQVDDTFCIIEDSDNEIFIGRGKVTQADRELLESIRNDEEFNLE